MSCAPSNADGNRQIYRYRHDGSEGWVATTGWADQVAVDGKGLPWAKTVQGIAYRANLNGSQMPTTWASFPAPSGTVAALSAGAHLSADIPISMLSTNGHVYTFRASDGAWRNAFSLSSSGTILYPAGALPYFWFMDTSGQVYRTR